MDQIDLFHSRQTWMAIFRSGAEIHSSEWTDWADSRIRSPERMPEWVLNLSMADARGDATNAVRTDIGRDYAEVGAEALDDQALLIGFVYERYAAGDITASGMWFILNSEVDFAQFMDDEKWKQFSASGDVTTKVAGAGEGNVETEMVSKLAPLGLFARQQASKHLGIATFP